MRWLVMVVLASGCYSPSSAHCLVSCDNATCPSGLACGSDLICHDEGTAECSADSPDGGLPSEICVGSTAPPFTQFCFPPPADGPRVLALTLDTTKPCDLDAIYPEVCVLVGASIAIDTGTKVTGARPLVIAAAGELAIGGVLDAAGHAGSAGVLDTDRFPPAARLSCASPDGQSTNTTSAAAGGAGGSFGGRGGPGGATSIANGQAQAAPAMMPTTLQGGCFGGTGGAAAGPGGGAGHGGGAVYLLAGSKLTIEGTVNASGGGGGLATALAGGGGGGSGGMILAWARDEIVLTGSMFALGGGGSSGANGSGMAAPGDDPGGVSDPAMATSAITGAGIGGAGSRLNTDGGFPGANTTTQGGAGGGGGGDGVIKLDAPVIMGAQGRLAPLPQ